MFDEEQSNSKVMIFASKIAGYILTVLILLITVKLVDTWAGFGL